jgi:hypothetical protein
MPSANRRKSAARPDLSGRKQQEKDSPGAQRKLNQAANAAPKSEATGLHSGVDTRREKPKTEHEHGPAKTQLQNWKPSEATTGIWAALERRPSNALLLSQQKGWQKIQAWPALSALRETQNERWSGRSARGHMSPPSEETLSRTEHRR